MERHVAVQGYPSGVLFSETSSSTQYLRDCLNSLGTYYKEEKKLTDVLYSMFDNERNPLLFVLSLIRICTEQKTHKKKNAGKISVAILNVTKIWCNQQNVSRLLQEAQRSGDIRKIMESADNGTIIQLVCQIFQLEKEYSMQEIRNLVKNHKYKQAFYVISALNLEKEFDLKSCVFPLFFMGQENWLKEYLDKCPILQVEFLKTLDTLSANEMDCQCFIRSLDIDSVLQKNKPLGSKFVQKRLASLIDYFDIDIRECPNLFHFRTEGAMRYLFRKRFVEDTIDNEAWEEMMFDTIADFPYLQRELLVQLTSINEIVLAMHFANLFNLRRNEWPTALQIAATRIVDTSPLPTNPESQDYLQLRLDTSDIILVKTPEALTTAIEDVSENYDVIGIDAEWKPNLGVSKERVALLQLAVWDCIYLLDIMVLKNYHELWNYMLQKIFLNKEILKLGFGLRTDLHVVMKTLGIDEECISRFVRIVDLGDFFKKLKTHYPEVNDEIESWHPAYYEDQDSLKGLSLLCKTVLGQPLNKKEQFSNWECRPLRQNQIVYAALDAYCLLQVYENIYPVLISKDLDLEKVLHSNRVVQKPENSHFIASVTTTSSHQERAVEPVPTPPTNPSKEVAASELKVLLDSTTAHLAKHFRFMGADALSLDEQADCMRIVTVAQSENRCVITTRGPHQKIINYLPREMCYCIDPTLTVKQQLSEICNHFNIICKESDIFSRCTKCNGNNYIKVLNEELFALWTKHIDPSMRNNLHSKNSTVFKCNVLDMDGTMHQNIWVQLAAFAPKVFEYVEHFFLCARCGKVYWQGSHLARLKKDMSNYVAIEESNHTFYEMQLRKHYRE